MRICDVSLARHHITLIKQFSDIPQMLLDKHRVLQILINLINNAKQALGAGTNRPSQIILRLKAFDDRRVRSRSRTMARGYRKTILRGCSSTVLPRAPTAMASACTVAFWRRTRWAAT